MRSDGILVSIRGGRQHTQDSAAGAGRCLQPLRHSLRSREPDGSAGQEAGDTGTAAQHQVVLPQDKLLPIQAHLREGHQRVDDSGSLEAKGYDMAI